MSRSTDTLLKKTYLLLMGGTCLAFASGWILWGFHMALSLGLGGMLAWSNVRGLAWITHTLCPSLPSTTSIAERSGWKSTVAHMALLVKPLFFFAFVGFLMTKGYANPLAFVAGYTLLPLSTTLAVLVAQEADKQSASSLSFSRPHA